MRHIFIYNPAAGHDSEAAVEALREHMKQREDISYEFYATMGPGDATRFVRECCEREGRDALRFYACGGDGTANEVLHGIVGAKDASMTCFPCGSGNDYVKYYGGADNFLDVDALISGVELPVDIMRIDDCYSLNVTNFGFDTTVAKVMQSVKHKWLIGGKNAYNTGIAAALFTAMKNECVVSVDGEQLNEEKILLCTVANGKYVGGAFCCAPHSVNDDGLLEVCLVKPISYVNFIKLIGSYQKGQHLDDPRFAKYITYRRGKSVHVKAPEGFAFSLDGEIVEKNDFTIEICPAAVRFVVTEKVAREMGKMGKTAEAEGAAVV